MDIDSSLEALNFRKSKFPLNKDQCALLIIDMQRFFLESSSHAYLSDGEDAIKRINSISNLFRKNNSPVIFTQHIHKEGSDAGTMGKWWSDIMWEGNPLLDLDPRLKKDDDDLVIQKDRYDAFLNTDLETILKDKGITQVLITGVMTNLCAETTARSAFNRDFEVFFIHDCTGAASPKMHRSTLLNLVYGFAILLNSEEVIEQLEGNNGV